MSNEDIAEKPRKERNAVGLIQTICRKCLKGQISKRHKNKMAHRVKALATKPDALDLIREIHIVEEK